jgi:PAS domain S-box-containing protein
MLLQQTPYTIPLIAASVISILLGIYAMIQRPFPGRKLAFLIILASTEWTLMYAFELASADMQTKILWNKLEYFGIVTAPVAWFTFIVHYTGREKWLRPHSLKALSIIPVITLFLVWTNEYHGLIWSSLFLDTDLPFSILINIHGPWFWVHTIYSYTLLFIGVASLAVLPFTHRHSLYRRQAGILLLGALAPLIANMLYLSGLDPFPGLDLTPVAFMVINPTVVFSVLYFRVGDIVPKAQRAVIESMKDIVMVLDNKNRVLDMNPSAQQVIGDAALAFIGLPIEDIWPEWSDRMPLKANSKREPVLDYKKRIYDVSTSPLTDWRGHTVGTVIVLRDMTALNRSLREKEILLREIHHRVKNNIQIISSLLNLQTHYIKDKSYIDMLRESQHRIRSMGLIHEKLYQSENLAEIDFTEYVKTLVYSLFRSYGVNTGRIAVKTDIEDISLDIDTAIPCGLIINELVSNSLKYAFPGERTGEITIQLHSRNGHIELVVADNGTGIPEHIDFRTTSSLGLHLVTILVEEQLKGEISLDRNKGTAFHITFRKKQSQNC